MNDFDTFICAIRERDLSKVRQLFKQEFIMERSENGWTALHWASWYGDSGDSSNGDIVRYLLSEGCDIEDEITDTFGLRRYRSIHLAAMDGYTDIVRALIEGQCFLNCVTPKGKTPLQLAIQNGSVECQRLLEDALTLRNDLVLLKNANLLTIMDAKTGTTVLDKLLNNNNDRIISAIKSRVIKEKGIEDWVSNQLNKGNYESHPLLHACLLYISVHQRHHLWFKKLCTPHMVNNKSIFMEPTTLECTVESGIKSWVKHVLKRLIGPDESWTRAEDIAKTKGMIDITDLMSSRRAYLYRRKLRGYGRLHIAVYDKVPAMIEYLLETSIVDKNEGDKMVGSALSLAYDLDYINCARSIEKYKVRVDTVDIFKRSPLHVAISNRMEVDHCDYLIVNMEDTGTKDYIGFTVLDRSIINNYSDVCARLLKKGFQWNDNLNINTSLLKYDIDISKIPHMTMTKNETIYTLCIKCNQTLFPCLLETIDRRTIDIPDDNGNTPLHLSAVSLMSEICSQLLLKKANVDYKNEKENTPLLELLDQNNDRDWNEVEESMVATVKVLIEGGASIYEEDSKNIGVFAKAAKYNSERLLLALIDNEKPILRIGHSQWSHWFQKQYFTLIGQVLPRINTAVQLQYFTIDDIKLSLNGADISLIKTMYDLAVEYVQEATVESILYKAAQIDDLALFRELIEANVNAKGYLEDKESLLNCLIRDRRIDYIRVVIASRNGSLFLEKKNAQNKLPLHVCIDNELWNVIDTIILKTTSVNDEDDGGDTPLSMLFRKMSESSDDARIRNLMDYVKMIILRHGDIYKENKLNRAVITYCTKAELKLEIETYFRNRRPQIRAILQPPPVRPTMVHPRPQRAVPSFELCRICLDEPSNCVLNCGHVFGMACAKKEIRCYSCRQTITGRTQMFI